MESTVRVAPDSVNFHFIPLQLESSLLLKVNTTISFYFHKWVIAFIGVIYEAGLS